MKKVVIDTSVLISALIGKQGPSREIIKACLKQELTPLISNALFLEYEDVSARPKVNELCPLPSYEIRELLNAFYSRCQWVSVSYLWRPNLSDEGDNFLIELAVAGQARVILTNNLKDLHNAELKFDDLSTMSPEQFLQEEDVWQH